MAHVLVPATLVWRDARGDFEANRDETNSDNNVVDSSAVKQVAEYMRNCLIKFGASASVADASDIAALKTLGEDIAKAFSAVVGMLLSTLRFAGPTLRAELLELGDNLAGALDILGAGIGATSVKEDMPTSVGKVLNRIKEFEKISRDNRAAIKRQILYCLVLIRDAHKEMQEAIDKSDKIAEGGADDDSDEDAMEDEDGLDETLDESEKLVASTVVALTVALEDALKQASKIASKGDGDADLDWGLQTMVPAARTISSAVDGLIVSTIGGLEVDKFGENLVALRCALSNIESLGLTKDVNVAVDAVEEALNRAREEDN